MSVTPTVAVLGALAVTVALGWLGERVAQILGQPSVVGELALGIAIGPIVAALESTIPVLEEYGLPVVTGLADVGLMLFMFTIGLEVGPQGRALGLRSVVGISLGSAAVPFITGFLIALAAPGDSSPMFIGLAFSVTALPVLARIIEEHRLATTVEGRAALLAAAAIDALTWVALAVVIGLSQPDASWPAFLVAPFAAALLVLGRRVARLWLAKATIDGARLTLVVAGLVASSAFTEAIGVHFIIGAFLFGLAMPRQRFTERRTELVGKIAPLTNSVLLPAFFVVTGAHVSLSALTGSRLLLAVLVLIGAVVAKVGGTFLGGVATRLPARSSWTIAVLMNARGLTELVVLEAGRQAGLLDSSWYSIMVVVALATTAITGPILALTRRRDRSALSIR